MTDRHHTPLTADRWYKSSYSANNNDCVEVSIDAQMTRVRDSKRLGPVLSVPGPAFRAFTEAVRRNASL